MEPGSVAGWVRGWGLGALHPALSIQRSGVCGSFLWAKLFSSPGPPGGVAATRARATRRIERQLDMPAIWKLEVSQMDVKSSPASAAALDDVARADREPAGEITWEQGHDNPPRNQQPSWNLPPPMPDQRDSSATGWRLPLISGQNARALRGTLLQVGNSRPGWLLRNAFPGKSRKPNDNPLRVKDRNRSPAPRP